MQIDKQEKDSPCTCDWDSGGLTGLSGTVTCVGGGRNSQPFPDDEVHHCIQRKKIANTQAEVTLKERNSKKKIEKVHIFGQTSHYRLICPYYTICWSLISLISSLKVFSPTVLQFDFIIMVSLIV